MESYPWPGKGGTWRDGAVAAARLAELLVIWGSLCPDLALAVNRETRTGGETPADLSLMVREGPPSTISPLSFTGTTCVEKEQASDRLTRLRQSVWPICSKD